MQPLLIVSIPFTVIGPYKFTSPPVFAIINPANVFPPAILGKVCVVEAAVLLNSTVNAQFVVVAGMAPELVGNCVSNIPEALPAVVKVEPNS